MADITETDNKFLNSLVQDCITYKLSEREALEYIRLKFRPISLSSLRLRKARVLSHQSMQIWLNDFTRIGFVANHREHIEHIERIRDDSLRQLFIETMKQPRNEPIILKIKQDIRDNTQLLSELNLGTPIISAIKAKLESRERENNNSVSSDQEAIQVRQ